MSESSNLYLDKVVVIDGSRYNNTAVFADNSGKIAPATGVRVPNAGDKDEGSYTGVYVAKGATGDTSSRTDLETLVTRCSALTMYDPNADEFIRVQAAKLAILNQLDIFNTNTFSVSWPGMNIPVKYTFDDKVTWNEWIAKNSSTGFTLLDTETVINQTTIPKNTVVVQISQAGVETTFYIIATIKDGVYSFVSGDDLISKTDLYFFLVPGYPANVTNIKAISGSDGSSSGCKIDLSFTCVQGAIDTRQVAIGISTNKYPTWEQIQAANGGSTTTLASWKLIDITDDTNTITTSFTGLAECTHYISIFPIATGEIVNRNAENSDVNRITLKTFKVILLDPPTVRETNNNGDLLQYYGGNRYLKNFLSTVTTPDGYALTYGSDSSADIQIEGGVESAAGDYTATLTLSNSLYQWKTTQAATCTIDWSIFRMQRAFTAQFIPPTTSSNTDLPTAGVHDCGYAQSIKFEVRPYTGLDIDKLPITEECISVSFSGATNPTYRKVRTIEGGSFVFEILIDPFIGTANGAFTVEVPTELANNFSTTEIRQEFKTKGQVDNFNDNSWESILAAASAGKIPDSWKVGDCKEIRLAQGSMGELTLQQAMTVNAMIVNKTSTCLTFCFATAGSSPKPIAFVDSSFGEKNSYGDAFSANSTAVLNMDVDSYTNAKVNGYKERLKWEDCGMRTAILGSKVEAASHDNTLYNLLPPDLKSVMCIAKISSYGAEYNPATKKLGAARAYDSYDVLPLLSPSDIGLKTNECTTVNALKYFEDPTKRKFYRHNSSNIVCDIHLRDVWPVLGGTINTSKCNHSKPSEHCTFYVYQNDYIFKAYEDRSRGVAPIFFIGKRSGTALGGTISNYK